MSKHLTKFNRQLPNWYFTHSNSFFLKLFRLVKFYHPFNQHKFLFHLRNFINIQGCINILKGRHGYFLFNKLFLPSLKYQIKACYEVLVMIITHLVSHHANNFTYNRLYFQTDSLFVFLTCLS